MATSTSNRRHRGCERTLAAGSLSFAAAGGADELVFQGRLAARHRLTPGRYTLIVTAADATGTSSPRSLRFTIVA